MEFESQSLKVKVLVTLFIVNSSCNTSVAVI